VAEPDPQHLPTDPVPPHPQSPATRVFFGPEDLRAGWALLLFGLIFLIVYGVLGSALATLLPPPHPNTGLFSPGFIIRGESTALIAVLFATYAMARLERRSFTAFGLSPDRLPSRLAAGGAFGLGLLALLVAGLRVSGYLVFESRLLHGAAILQYALEWAFAFSLVALYEENLFRGYLQATLTRGLAGLYRLIGARSSESLGFWTSAVLLSFGFGSVHTQNMGESPIGIVAAGLIGVIFCLSLWRTGSLWWAIGFHAAWDWGESFLFGVYDSGTLAQGRLFQTHPQGRLLLSGGLTGPEGSVLVLPTLLVITLAILITLPPSGAASASTESSLSSPIDLA
jgi:uncharacterized protein